MKNNLKELSPILIEVINYIFCSFRSLENALSGYDNTLQEALVNAKNDLINIQSKLNDNRFFVGIAGEFSCGKSTFINAFLETRRLVEAPTPCTTCAGTVIEYADHEDIIITYQNGTKCGIHDTSYGNNYITAEDFLCDITTDEKKAKNVREVLWRVPLPVLQKGLCLVDTPGVNSENERHTEATKEILSKCDAIIILTSLIAPLSQSLCKFTYNISGNSAANCIIIGTYKDKILQNDLVKVNNEFEKKLKNKFGRAIPFFFVSAFKALEELEGGNGDNLTDFRNVRENIRNFLEQKRTIIQSKKISSMLLELIEKLNTELTNQKEKFAEARHNFENAVIPENDPSWANLIRIISREFNDEVSIIFSYTLEQLTTVFYEFLELVKGFIYRERSKDSLKEYVTSGIKIHERLLLKKVNDISVNAESSIEKLAREKHQSFIQEIDRRKNNLTMGIISSFVKPTMPSIFTYNTIRIEPICIFLSNSSDSGIFSFVFSLFESLEDKKKEVWGKIYNKICHSSLEVKEELKIYQSNLQKKYEEVLTRLMKEKLDEYEKLVSKYNYQMRQKTLELEVKEKFVSNESATLSILQRKIDAYVISLSENQF